MAKNPNSQKLISAKLNQLADIQEFQSQEICLIKEYLGIETIFSSNRVIVKKPSAFRRWWNYIIRKDRW